MQFKDCLIHQTQDGFIIENEMIQRKVVFIQNTPVIEWIKDKITNRIWTSTAKPTAAFHVPILDFNCCTRSFSTFIKNGAPLSEDCLVAETRFETPDVTLRWQNSIYPGIAFVVSKLFISAKPGTTSSQINNKFTDKDGYILPPADTIEAFRLNSRHTRLTSAELMDVSDHCNNFVKESTEIPYLMWEQSFDGQFFMLDDYIHGDGLMIVKEAPCPAGRINKTCEDLQLYNASYAFVIGSGTDYSALPQQEFQLYQAAVGTGDPSKLKDEYQRLYLARFTGNRSRGLYMMSNTWGDRNQDKAVCESFMLEEIKRAAELGIDVVQIDDGWQTGRTANSAIVINNLWSGGYYDVNPDFWVPDSVKFPRGLEYIAREIEKNSLLLGLWFSPDLIRDYEFWQKDADVLVSLHEQYNVLFFKLDGLTVTNKEIETNLIKMMRQVTLRTKGKVWFNMDITAQVRFGHLYQPEFGSLFVENRYSDSCNYYPHYTLKNLWELSKYLPVSKCQFELLNVRRNADLYSQRYGEEDPLRPALYPMDTVFATTMLSCPLFWMELSHLAQEDVNLLAGIVSVFKKHRQRLAAGTVRPIGSLPDGVCHTGFIVECENNSGYLLLFREFSPLESFRYSLDTKGKKFNVLYTNGDGVLNPDQEGITASFSKTASFLFAEFQNTEN